MRVVAPLLAALLIGCGSPPPPAPARPPPDPFHAEVAAGCSSETECRALHAEALRRVQPCDAYRVRIPMCDEKRRDATITAGYVRPYDERRAAEARRREEERRALEAKLEEEQRRVDELARALAEAKRKAAEERAAAEEYERARQAVAENIKPCSVKHDEAACDALSAFASKYPNDPKTPELTAILQKHWDFVAKQGGGQAASGQSAAPAPKSTNEGRVCCCDGTISPTCTYVKRGCCSHHKGVCPCD